MFGLLLAGILPKYNVFLLVHPMMSPYHIGDVHSDPLIKTDPSAFFSVKLQFSPL